MGSATKFTFTFDLTTIHRLNYAAQRLSKPKSEVVRRAIQEFAERVDRVSEDERLRRLQILDEYDRATPRTSQSEADAELKELRLARRSGGRRHPL